MFVHSSRLRKQLEYLNSRGIETQEIYELLGSSEEEMLDSDRTYGIDSYIQVMEFGIRKTGDLHYGMHLGQEPHIAGTLGMLCASCRNLKEAFQEGTRFFKVQGSYFESNYIDDRNFPRIQYMLEPSFELKVPQVARHEVEAMFSFLSTIVRLNSNGQVLPYRIDMKHEQVGEADDYEKALGLIPHFSQERNEMMFRQKDLMIPMKAFNPDAYSLLRSHIENQLRKLDTKTRMSEKVRSILLSSLRYSFPDMESVASRLHVSTRTLQRLLSNENTSYKVLLQDTRFELARQLLQQEQLTISEISYMLGYSDLGNFSRSFKKYNGMSPQEYRKSKDS